MDSIVVTPKGAVKVVKVYTAPYWVHNLTDTEWKRQKLRFAALLAGIAVFYAAAAFLPSGSSHWAPVGLFGGLALAALVLLAGGMTSYLFCPRKMTVYEHRHSTSSVCCWSLLTALGMTITGAMSGVYLLVIGGDELLLVLTSAFCYLISAASAYTIYRTERATEYYKEENDNIL